MSDVTGSSLRDSSVVSNTEKFFDVRDPSQVLLLLRQVHQSALQPEDKNKLRDALFTFTSSHAVEPSRDVVSLFATYGFSIVHNTDILDSASSHVVPESEKHIRIGRHRPCPQFGKGTVTIHSNPTNRVPESTKSTLKQEVQSEVQEKQVVADGSSPIPQTSTEEQLVSQVSPHTVDPSTRIKEIKKEINALVGNPVNLIDAHNEIGREYMNSLLDAMKKNNGGSIDEVHEAMQRLEKAFVEVKRAVGTGGSDQQVSPETKEDIIPASTHVVSSESSIKTKDITEASLSVSKNDTDLSENKNASNPDSLVSAKANNTSAVSGFASVLDSHVDTASKEQVIHTAKQIPTSIPPDISTSPVPKSPDVSGEQPTKTDISDSDVHIQDTSMMSVAKQKQIQDLMNAQKQKAATTDKQKEDARLASMDPLLHPEVTNGLQQLLSEWSLFKSSGFFGTGPSGIEHPLFKKLAKLNMSAVVAGRFEGATPQIKRSISDYMNGWRYEEGIVQEQGELFEHYLRRVIKHILDKRKK